MHKNTLKVEQRPVLGCTQSHLLLVKSDSTVVLKVLAICCNIVHPPPWFQFELSLQ